MAAVKLFESDDDTDEISKLEIDQKFKERHEYNEKRKDLHRLEELENNEIVDSEDESSESEAEEFDDDDDIKRLMDGLVKVKNQDPIIKQKDAKLFESEDEESEEESDIKETKSKPKYLKDVIAEKLLEDGGEDKDDDDDSKVRPHGKSYNQEQEALRKKFLDVVEREFDNDDDEDLLKEKKRGEEGEDAEDEEIKKKCDDYFGNDEGLDENEKFLKNFIVKKLWVDKGRRPQIDDLEVLSEDDEEVWDQLDFERNFNFRYEEGTGDRILGHSRVIDGAVRKKVNRREEQRKRREDRMAEANKRNREELKHLKNLKMKEIMEKLDKIRAIGGLTEGALDVDDLEDDFDPEEYDKKMKKTFNDDYYNAEDADFGDEEDDEDGDIEKPDFDKEDELLGLPKDWDVCGTGDGFVAVRERVLKMKAGIGDVENEEHGDDAGDTDESDLEDEEKPEEGKRKRKHKLSSREKVALSKELDEYDKLDYEGRIGDLQTRFKYAKVPPLRFSLSAEEIINMDDKELNQYVSLKKIATYTEVEWKVSKKLRNQLKMKNKLIEQEALSKHGKRPKNGFRESRTVEPVAEEKKIVQVEKVNGNVGQLSRKRKRKELQKEVKPSKQRRAAYGVGDPKPKKKKN